MFRDGTSQFPAVAPLFVVTPLTLGRLPARLGLPALRFGFLGRLVADLGHPPVYIGLSTQ
jgi:hypothetical protein